MYIKRITAYILVIISLVTFIPSLKQIYADDIYPLENGEELMEEIMIDKNHIQIYTQLGEELHMKKLQWNNDKWMVESIEALEPRWTGLEIEETAVRGDRKLAAALENELESYGLAVSSLPPILDYSHSEFLPPAGDQKYENSCVGWAAGYYLRTYQQAKELGWPVKESGMAINSHIFSPSFIYNKLNGGVDKGTTIIKANELLTDTGIATLEDFPYIAGDYRTQPSQQVIQSAYPHRIRKWLPLFSNLDSSQYIIQKTREYLNTGDLVVVGGKIGFKFKYPYFDVYGNSIITREENPWPLHAYVIAGYDDNFISPDGIGAFKILSSWGAGWGNEGYSYISYDAFTANILEGYVYTDLVNAEPLELETEINDTVTFNMDFSGSGRFDIQVKDANEQMVFEAGNLQGHEGINSLVWNGRDISNNPAADGPYKLSIIPYIGDMPKPAFDLAFNKQGKVEAVATLAYTDRNGVQYVDIPMKFKSDCLLSIKVDYNGTVTELISNQAVTASESRTYTIYKSEFDFNNINLEQLRIMIDIS